MENAGEFDVLRIQCPQCGMYELAGLEGINSSYQWPPELRKPLSCATRQSSEVGQTLRITGTPKADELAESHRHTRVSDNQERLLRELGRRANRPDCGAWLNPATDFTLIDCFSEDELRWHISWLEKQHLVFRTGGGAINQVGQPTSLQLLLSMEGWNRIQPLQRPGGIPGNCFVAMSFSAEMRPAYQRGIQPAISDAGFKAIRIDRKEHNNEITDEIMAEIRNCQFMVADFTGQRQGVYYEAGFAVGLGRAVIWCCRKDEIGKLHFDTNHKNHIDWETPEELRERLYRRIRATILYQG